MFENEDKQTGTGDVEDIFAGTDSIPSNLPIAGTPAMAPSAATGESITVPEQSSVTAEQSLPANSAEFVPQSAPPAPAAPPDENVLEMTEPHKKGGIGRVIAIIFVVLLVIALVAVALFLAMRFLSERQEAMLVDDPVIGDMPAQEAPLAQEPVTPIEPAPLEGSEAVSGTQNPLELIDTDGDGLSDAEESRLGTDPTLVDTDGDGLTDYEEVRIYFTDPLNQDTDGDGFIDGVEVRNGYNPRGPGRLFQVPGSQQ